jgi:hypothetical protein
MSTDDEHVHDLIAKREAAERAVEGMPEGPRKEKAFEMVFQRLLDGHTQPRAPRRRGRGKQVKARTSEAAVSTAAPKSRKASPREHLNQLVENRFFDSGRSLPEIAEELRKRGHIYGQSALSPHVLAMTRDSILRRDKDQRDDGREMWFYKRAN